MSEVIFTAPASGLYSYNGEIFFELSKGDKYVGLPKIHLDALRVRVDELEKENEELKLHIADRSEKYKIAMDKGVDVLSAEIKALKSKLEKANKLINEFDPDENFVFEDGSEELEESVREYLKGE